MAADQEERSSRRGPPQLKLHLASRLAWLAVFNILPLGIMGYLWWNWRQGNLEIIVDQGLILLLGMLLGMAVLVGTVSFLVLPIVSFACRKTKWHFHYDSKLSWFLPLVGTHLLAFCSYVICLALIMAGLWVTGLVAIQSFAPGLLGDSHQTAAEPNSNTPAPTTAVPQESQ